MKSLFDTAIDCEAAGDFNKAYELLARCLSDNSHTPGEIAFHLGWCLENSGGDKQQAVRLYAQAVEQAQDIALKSSAAFRAGWLLLLDKEYGKAAAVFSTIINLIGDPKLNHDLRDQAQYWYAMSLEHLGRFLEAAQWYQNVAHVSSSLSPESIYRTIVCYNCVGKYDAALSECTFFPRECPPAFDPNRHKELLALIKKEERLLLQCLDGHLSSKEER